MQWSYAQRLDELRRCMEGRANDFIDLVLGREPRLNYLEVVERMERRFDYQEPPESAQLEFSTARQGANEPLLDWADRVYVLAARAFPGVQEAYRQRQAVLRLCQGCADKEAGCYALDCQPVTIDEAIEAMLNWYQHSRRVFYGRARPAKVMALSSGKMITPPRPTGPWGRYASLTQVGAPGYQLGGDRHNTGGEGGPRGEEIGLANGAGSVPPVGSRFKTYATPYQLYWWSSRTFQDELPAPHQNVLREVKGDLWGS